MINVANCGLRPAKILREELNNWQTSEIIALKEAIAEAINSANTKYITSISLGAFMSGKSIEMQSTINKWLEDNGYIVNQYSDYRGSYYGVSW